MKKEKSFTHSTPLALTALRLLTLTRAPEMRERERERESCILPAGSWSEAGMHLSPTLFNIYINELAEALDRSGSIPGLALHDSEVKCLLYADDLVLLSPTAEGLQHSLALLEQYCGMGTDGQPGQNQSHGVPEEGQVSGKNQFTYGGEVLEHSTSYRDLSIRGL